MRLCGLLPAIGLQSSGFGLRYCNICILYGILTTSIRDHVPNDYYMSVLVDAGGSGFCAEAGFHSQICVCGCFAHQAHSHDLVNDVTPPKRVNASVAFFERVAWKVIRASLSTSAKLRNRISITHEDGM